MAVYVTGQNQTVDLICWQHYGRTTGTVEAVLEANRGLAARGVVLPIGLEIILPDVPAPAAKQTVRLFD